MYQNCSKVLESFCLVCWLPVPIAILLHFASASVNFVYWVEAKNQQNTILYNHFEDGLFIIWSYIVGLCLLQSQKMIFYTETKQNKSMNKLFFCQYMLGEHGFVNDE
jgi:hypothetical protein